MAHNAVLRCTEHFSLQDIVVTCCFISLCTVTNESSAFPPSIRLEVFIVAAAPTATILLQYEAINLHFDQLNTSYSSRHDNTNDETTTRRETQQQRQDKQIQHGKIKILRSSSSSNNITNNTPPAQHHAIIHTITEQSVQ